MSTSRAPELGKAREPLSFLESFHGHASDTFERAVDVQVRRLRERIEIDPSSPALVNTIYGVGYAYTSSASEGEV